MSHGDTILPRTVEYIADLQIGEDVPGRIISSLRSPEDKTQFGGELTKHVHEITKLNTVGCMDDRPIESLGDGTVDADSLAERVTAQWAGGAVLATLKAGLAANAGFLRDAKNIQEAYLITAELLERLNEEDGGHAKCGASGLVEKSVACPVPRELALPTMGAIISVNESRRAHFDRNAQNKQRLLDKGFYSTWSSAWHEEQLQATVPQNFAHLQATHEAKGVLIVQEEGVGFSTNGLFEATGGMAFGVTVPKVLDLAHKLSANAEEREAMIVGYATDLLDVSSLLLGPDMPAFKYTA